MNNVYEAARPAPTTSDPAAKNASKADINHNPAPKDEPVLAVGPVKWSKRRIKEILFSFCRLLNSTSLWIQYHALNLTLEQKRSFDNSNLPLERMDRDLLAMYIRWIGHTVEKTVRYRKSKGGRGFGKPQILRAALDEWYRRQYPLSNFIRWAEQNLVDFKKWDETGDPQIHPEHELPPFNENSPIFEVLTNRVSTRFWKPLPVEQEKIQKVLRAACYAPTSCNRQTWKLYVHSNANLEDNIDPRGVANAELRERAPIVVYITIDERLYPEVWAPAQDAGIIGLQMSLAVAALGLGGLLMYGGDNFPQEAWRKQYNVPSYRYMHLMLLFGYPAERTLTDKRADLEDIAIFV